MSDRNIFYIVDKRDGSGPFLYVLGAVGELSHAFKIDTKGIARLNHECADHLRRVAEQECQMSGNLPDRLDPLSHGADSEC